MRYQVTYRLLHPAYLPAIRTSKVEARSHTELETRLAALVHKWYADGYTLRVLSIRPVRGKRRRPN